MSRARTLMLALSHAVAAEWSMEAASAARASARALRAAALSGNAVAAAATAACARLISAASTLACSAAPAAGARQRAVAHSRRKVTSVQAGCGLAPPRAAA